MTFSDDIARHVEQIRGRLSHVKGNEQATKQALVIPLLQVLGYDVFNPREVRPEYVADFAIKNGTTYKMLRMLNPWLRSRSLPVRPGKVYEIKLPAE